jgi:hypothetical protein
MLKSSIVVGILTVALLSPGNAAVSDPRAAAAVRSSLRARHRPRGCTILVDAFGDQDGTGSSRDGPSPGVHPVCPGASTRNARSAGWKVCPL